MTKAERETVIRWDEESKTITVWSASPVVLRKLARLGLTPTRESRRRTGEMHGRQYTIPLALFRWGLKRKGHPSKTAFSSCRAGLDASLSTERAPVHTQTAPDTEPGPGAA
jgi:hypothetical protein